MRGLESTVKCGDLPSIGYFLHHNTRGYREYGVNVGRSMVTEVENIGSFKLELFFFSILVMDEKIEPRRDQLTCPSKWLS